MKKPLLMLPDAKGFNNMPLKDRPKLFWQWVKAQPPEQHYNFLSGSFCPLAHFGRAILRSHHAEGLSDKFLSLETYHMYLVLTTHMQVEILSMCTTYGELAIKLEALV